MHLMFRSSQSGNNTSDKLILGYFVAALATEVSVSLDTLYKFAIELSGSNRCVDEPFMGLFFI